MTQTEMNEGIVVCPQDLTAHDESTPCLAATDTCYNSCYDGGSEVMMRRPGERRDLDRHPCRVDPILRLAYSTAAQRFLSNLSLADEE